MRFAAFLCLVAGVGAGLATGGARADDATQLDLAVGETVERDVGIAVGLRCDDLTLARIELRTVTPESNRFAVTGVSPGTGLTRLRAYGERGTPRFAAIAERGRPAGWARYADLDGDGVAKQLEANAAYPIDLDATRGDRGVRFTVVMVRER